MATINSQIANTTNKPICFGLAVNVPSDGTCLFHAMSLPFRIDGHGLRKFISSYISNHAEKELHGQTIKDWIYWDKSTKSEEYSKDIDSGMWGGALEITLFSSIIGIPIFIYEPDDTNKRCNLISECYPDKSLQLYFTEIKNIGLLWVNKSHYMNLDIRYI